MKDEIRDDSDILAYCEQELVRAGAEVDHLSPGWVRVTLPGGKVRELAIWRYKLICLDTLNKVAAADFGEAPMKTQTRQPGG